ncbi:putative ferric reductase [Desulfocurvibacter africanus PCS]|uniref:Putative ferric reductase n=1 Tax=Desulfocurvibacter africanus PCS TaxID=1262666 RepID=M5PRK6_DESAF|nr:ferric reductase-like transmembrane domain-containing protein [Desulfocurvibacter africanus]EMG36997.1 putative ferric reductase [Desulfocurvibacter africanus PCS]
MLTISKSSQRYTPIILSVILTQVVWLGSKWFFQDWFDDPFKYPAKAASLTATVLMCWCIALSTRWRPIEDYFGGLDKVYQVHKRLGRWSFYIILIHPLCLAAHRLPDPLAFLRYFWFQELQGDPYLVGHNLGIITLMLMAGLVTLTLWIQPPYHIWKRSHEWFGLVLLLVIAHIWFLDADIAAYPLLRALMYALLAIAAASFVYIRFLYRFLGPHYRYAVSRLEKIADILELTFAPQGRKMDFKPSQFVYLVVRKPGISPEPHPYSIACGYSLGAEFKLGIKQTGDHTRSIEALTKGDPVDVYGPYGRFSDRFLAGGRDCVFIGGGIGITPFLGMWHVALHSEERLSAESVSGELRRMHPEIIKTWKSPRVFLFYVCREEHEASFDDDIRQEVVLSQFHGFDNLEKRGHRYELYLSSKQGRIDARYIADRVPGGVLDKDIYLCGPTPMVDSLISQFRRMGVPADQFVVEDFNLL